ncbi:ParB/RepB/Spo0J family partition protein [Aureliella helgolandensis]|uniref:Putative chromosome-partitioning protein ParB n=1 Tax=Aureliella helgolandensis TaxID=2527968 RepID=A0A518G5Y5_9BACT|nr:ParB/RepB/Spo0J family partition protein [Aureliella helgolandensis]QDV24001.1 putative chromosome-partitioning protein ParB [Aureliella helgolandensis]
MTKDRRLGRGLAALLGTPLEEDQVLDSTATGGTNRTATPMANRSPQQVRPAMSPPSSPRVQGASVSLPEQRSQPTGSASSSSKVTGSVPLRSEKASSPSMPRALELQVDEIDNNPFQPRRQFNAEEIASLAESIREHQQLQPVLVRKVGDRYQLISGERRLRATIHAGLKTIRAEVRQADDRLVAELAIVENLQRKDLDPIEKALSFRRYIDEHQCTQEDLAKRLKIDRSTIANLMRLLELPEAIQQSIQSDSLTAGHARALLPLGDETQQLDFARQITEDRWSVRETERRVSEQLALEDGAIAGSLGGGKKSTRKRVSPQIAALEQQLRLALGTKTELKQSASGKGRIVISFANADEFDRICALICPSVEHKAA